jgi:hypothetical protein
MNNPFFTLSSVCEFRHQITHVGCYALRAAVVADELCVINGHAPARVFQFQIPIREHNSFKLACALLMLLLPFAKIA